MSEAVHISEALKLVVDRWLVTGGRKPLTLSLEYGGVVATQGVAKERLTGGEAAGALGVSYPTFKARFVDTGLLRRGDDGRFGRKAVEERLAILNGEFVG
mgnify:CR=1 FL=1